MRIVPQIRLRTFFLIFLCAALGLTVGTSPKGHTAGTRYSGWYVAQLDWHYALLAAGTVAVIIGLVHQSMLLMRTRPNVSAVDPNSFTRTFAAAWRIAIAGILSLCLTATVLIAREFVHLPDSETFLTYDVFPYAIWICCIIIVLSVSVARWRRPCDNNASSRWGNRGAWILGPLLAVLILTGVALVHNLVHIATHGIEFAHPSKFQRANTFLDQRAATFRLFWISAGAVTAVILAAASLVVTNRCSSEQRVRKVLGICSFALLLLLASTYCYWYFFIEFQRLSPDMAEVGIGSSWVDWGAGSLLAGFCAIIGAYRLSMYEPLSVPDDRLEPKELMVPPLYESALCLCVLFGAVVMYFVETIHALLSMRPFARVFSLGINSVLPNVFAVVLHDPCGLLITSLGALSLQLYWLRRRRGAECLDWRFAPLDQSRFAWNCLALAILAAVAVPTTSSFCFVFWLGPWYLYGP